jgi:hypothetical protein
LFEKTPSSVVEGQRAAYQGMILAEQNDEEILRRYEEDTKAAITYHVNFVYEPKINTIREDPDLSREDKSLQIAALERERQAKLDAVYGDIEENVEEMRQKVMQNHSITKKLLEAVYNYLSTSPIEIDNIEFWIEKLRQISEQPNQ